MVLPSHPENEKGPATGGGAGAFSVLPVISYGAEVQPVSASVVSATCWSRPHSCRMLAPGERSDATVAELRAELAEIQNRQCLNR